MSKRNEIKNELVALYDEGAKLATAFQKKEEKPFQYEYQQWYTKALSAIATLAPDRLEEFRGYYEVNPKRKSLGYGTYVIQDYLKGVAPNQHKYPDFDTRHQVLLCFFNQLTILKSVEGRVEALLANIEGESYAEMQDSEITVARELAKVSLRASGALIGVLIEGQLQKVAAAHGVKVAKRHPAISDLNDALKAAGVIDTPAWRKIEVKPNLVRPGA